MFSLREFLMKGFKDAVGNMADYQIILNATGYYEKNVLTEDDLSELQALIDEKNMPVEASEPPAEEEIFIPVDVDEDENSDDNSEETPADSEDTANNVEETSEPTNDESTATDTTDNAEETTSETEE